MKKLQREKDLHRVVQTIRTYSARLDEIAAFLTETARRGMQGRVDEQEARTREKCKAYEEEQAFLSKCAIPSLKAKQRSLTDDEGDDPGDETAETSTRLDALRYPHECFVEPMTRYFQEENVSPGQWYRFPVDRPSAVRVTLCQREYDILPGSLSPIDRADMSPFVTCYYDIETLSLDPESGSVIQVSLVFEQHHALEKHLVALSALNERALPDVHCHACNTEAEVLSTTARLIRERDPDHVVAYNGVNFDNRYLSVRASPGHAARLGVADFFFLSRFALKRTRLRELSLSSAGMGDNLLRYFDMPGRANFDWFVKLKRDLPSEAAYSLNHFARTICGDQKKDMDHREIPRLQAGTNDDRSRLGEYCVHDSVLLARLNKARTMVIEILQFASVFGIVPEWVYFRGQQVRFISQLLRKVRTIERVPILLNVPAGGFVGALNFGKYEGATVNEPIRGFFKRPVIVVDWASLYPSIMRGHNLCHSTYIDAKRVPAFVQDGWEVIPPSTAAKGDRAIVEHDIGDGKKTYFVHADVQRGILPAILEELASRRKAAKGMYKKTMKMFHEEEEGTARESYRILASVYDGQQLALKVAMNSIYGACGAGDAGKYPNLDISATVTAEGREAMVVKKKILPRRFPGVTIVYGDTDSIMMTFDDVSTIAESGVRGKEVATFVTQYFRDELKLPTMVMEFEKSFLPYLQEGKKRYAGNKFEPGVDDEMVPKGVDCKGIETERKDTLPFTRSIISAVLDDLMQRMDERLALRTFEAFMDRLVGDEVPFEQYIMKKNLSAKVAGKTGSIVQAKVNKDRRDRQPGSEAATGEQVEYVITNGHRKEKTTNLAQDPAYARESGMRPNRLWYFEHAIEEPVRKIFDLFPHIDFKRVRDRYRAILDSKRLGVSDSLQRMLVTGAGGRAEEGGGIGLSGAGYVPRPPPPKRPRKR
jgi:DNA polymerase delta subunit 1